MDRIPAIACLVGFSASAGALIALERNDRAVWAALKASASGGRDVLVPSAALAQVWRARRSQALLSRALEHCVVSSFHDVAWEVGELCGRTRTSDICDAHVAIVASRDADALYTSDPGDLRKLVAACRGGMPQIIRC